MSLRYPDCKNVQCSKLVSLGNQMAVIETVTKQNEKDFQEIKDNMKNISKKIEPIHDSYIASNVKTKLIFAILVTVGSFLGSTLTAFLLQIVFV
jgi:hypothetical protein